jgi:hypothetical protein
VTRREPDRINGSGIGLFRDISDSDLNRLPLLAFRAELFADYSAQVTHVFCRHIGRHCAGDSEPVKPLFL